MVSGRPSLRRLPAGTLGVIRALAVGVAFVAPDVAFFYIATS